ncbi:MULTISPECIES: GNAT family N-acetyltransferase [unclassified Ruegeria]|uniref:GNAT family N-acetyltransferase n=1 Tax=unclassified Ruegeria TaxID=2625375 RepID=UPI00148947DF|nr:MULTISPECIES: GNAT family N-acetyltransferase [unclassified Ruegeria]
MTNIIVRLASCEDDIEAARMLCREWLKWHWENYPSDWPRGDDHPMDPKSFEAILKELPALHERPLGGIIVASVDGKPMGCVMYSEARPGTAEFNRMFVSQAGRGLGLGRRLLNEMFEQLAADGYSHVFFSSATFLTQARAMYEDAGFVPMPQPESFPDKWQDKVYFMERSLA